MAKKQKDNGSTSDSSNVGTTKAHNVQHLDQVRRECAAAMRSINSQRAELNEEAGEIRERLKDNGIDVKAFMAALRLADMVDVSARDTYIDELRMSMASLGLGEQGEFFPKPPVTDGAQEGANDDPRPTFLKDKHEAGAADDTPATVN